LHKEPINVGELKSNWEKQMKNITTRVEKDKLVITVDLKAKTEPSKSGKSDIVASSEGNQKVEGTDVYIGLNVYRKK
jgi:hypothetical protein